MGAAFSSFTRRAAPRSIRQSAAARPISSTCARFAQGYGDGEADPKGETPQDQGPSNGTKHNAEHPGPAPPSEGKGTGAGPTKGVAHQRKLRHSQEDQEARRQRKLDPAQQAARLERAEVRAARVKALKRRAKMERHPKSPTMMFLARAIPRRSRRKLSNTIRNSSKAMTELLQLQRIRLTRSSGRVKEGLLITSRNTL